MTGFNKAEELYRKLSSRQLKELKNVFFRLEGFFESEASKKINSDFVVYFNNFKDQFVAYGQLVGDILKKRRYRKGL